MKLKAFLLIMLFTTSAEALNLIFAPTCLNLFGFGVLPEDVYIAMPDGAVKFNAENDSFLFTNREKLIKYYVRLPKTDPDKLYMGLNGTVEELQEILTKGIRALDDDPSHDVYRTVKEAALKSFENSKSDAPFFSVVVEINRGRCIGCFRFMDQGVSRVERRVELHAIANIFILSEGLRPSYQPMDLRHFRVTP